MYREEVLILLTRDDLSNLMEPRKGLCISVFLPTHRAGSEIQQDPIRFKNLLTEAEEQLESAGMRPVDARRMLEGAKRLLSDSMFWQHQGDSLAVFTADGFLEWYHLPIHVEEIVMVNRGFHLKPLLPIFNANGRFYVLALSKNQVKLHEGTRYKLGEVKIDHIPKSLEDFLKYDEAEKQLQLHTGRSAGKGKGEAIFHGHGVGTDDEKANLLRYCTDIDRGLQKFLGDDDSPLVLAAVDYIHPIFREANNHPNLIEDGIVGSPEPWSMEDLHTKAWEKVEPYFRKGEKEAAEKYRELMGTGKASNNITEIVPAAYGGRVDTLFVARGMRQWGWYDPGTNEVHITEDEKPESEDLLNLAVVMSLKHGGTIYALEPYEMPDTAIIASAFRY